MRKATELCHGISSVSQPKLTLRSTASLTFMRSVVPCTCFPIHMKIKNRIKHTFSIAVQVIVQSVLYQIEQMQFWGVLFSVFFVLCVCVGGGGGISI